LAVGCWLLAVGGNSVGCLGEAHGPASAVLFGSGDNRVMHSDGFSIGLMDQRLWQHPEWRRGCMAMLRALPGVMAWGLVTGMVMAQSGLPAWGLC